MSQDYPQKLLIDVCSGRWGWSKAFAARGWRCIGIDLTAPPEIPENCLFIKADLRDLKFTDGTVWLGSHIWKPDFLVASTPCEQFSVWGMAHFHPHPKQPVLGLELFNHIRDGFQATKLPWVMENVRAAQPFVGNAVHHCGPFYLWGSGVPPLMNQGIRKHMVMGESSLVNELKRNGDRDAIKKYRRQFDLTWNSSKSPERKEATARAATIPPELANCVCDFAERIVALAGT